MKAEVSRTKLKDIFQCRAIPTSYGPLLHNFTVLLLRAFKRLVQNVSIWELLQDIDKLSHPAITMEMNVQWVLVVQEPCWRGCGLH